MSKHTKQTLQDLEQILQGFFLNPAASANQMLRLLSQAQGNLARALLDESWGKVTEQAGVVMRQACAIAYRFGEPKENTASDFVEAVKRELAYACRKFPQSDAVFVALVEEVGELEEAIGNDEGPYRIWDEAVQVASTTWRLVVERDPTLEAVRRQRVS